MEFPDYLDVGKGPAVVFEHGTLMDATMFDPQTAYLAKCGYRSISHNSRTLTGRNDRHTLGDLAEDTVQLLDRLKLDKVVLVGMSVGGFMGIEFALKHRDRLHGLVLIDGKAVSYSPEQQVAYSAEFAKCDVEGPVPRFFAEWCAPIVFSAKTLAEQKPMVDYWVDRWATDIPARAVFNQGFSWMYKPDRTDRLHEIDVPVLLLHGAEDIPLPIDRAISMVQHLPDVTFVKVPGAGHTSNLENPDVVNRALGAFVDRVYGR
jgi:pimeloyl-ACP methyl ester carboxylesterase